MATAETEERPTLFNAIGLNLITAPASAWRDIEAAAMGWRPEQAPEIAWAATYARDWLCTIMAAEFAPDAKAVFLAYPMENGVCDTVRGLYRNRGGRIEVAQSRYFVALKLLDASASIGSDPNGAASEIAQMLFAGEEAKSLVFRALGQREFGSFGARDFERVKPVAPGWVHWADAMHWWSDGQTLGFMTLRGYGQMVREVVTADPFPNKSWFSGEPARMLSSR